MTGTPVFMGEDGSLRLAVRPGEGEYVCAECDVIDVAAGCPAQCAACGSDRIETLTFIQVANWPTAVNNGR